jgi:hypothetical protein
LFLLCRIYFRVGPILVIALLAMICTGEGREDMEEFGEAKRDWLGLSEGTLGKLIAIDGKTVRHSFEHATGRKALHIVSAWIAENRLTLGQISTEEKSNEITAIARLFEMLDIRGATITVDAMSRFELFVSQAVFDEAGAGDPGAAARRLGSLQGITVLEVTPAALACIPEELVE